MVTDTNAMAKGGNIVVPNVSSTMQIKVESASTSPRKVNDTRRSNKPIMEKRRRARINNCLNELKTLILDAMKKDPARHSKLEKADILEMTVKHLQTIQHQRQTSPSTVDSTTAVLNKFRAGFTECAGEVGRFPGLEPVVKRRLLNHLSTCITKTPDSTNPTTNHQIHILPTPEPAQQQQHHHQQQTILLGGNNGVQVVPTRLPNGDYALVLPPNSILTPAATSSANMVPLLMPIPTRTSSTASASSSSSSSHSSYNYSASGSPDPMEMLRYQPQHQLVSSSSNVAQKPLSLVMRRKSAAQAEEKPWRPW